MAKAQRLRLSEIRDIFRLVGECRELGGDPIAWRQHALAGLSRLLGGAVAMSMELQRLGDPAPNVEWVRVLSVVEYGWPTAAERGHFWRFMADGPPDRHPMMGPMSKAPEALISRRRCEVVADAVWYNGAFVNEYLRAAGSDDNLISAYVPASGLGHTFNVSRRWGDGPFEVRQRRLLHLCHGELAALRGRRLATGTGPSIAELPVRLRQVLLCLLEGDSEKQAAARLNIRPATAHEYVKRLHRRLGVQSRGELFARCWRLLPTLQNFQQGLDRDPEPDDGRT
jgi:DNA-binding CsgD family transcriptional regulator